jgi:hypothetical protein
MTIHSPARAAAALPAQAAQPPEPQPPEQPFDHVRKHPPGCYWDLRDCRWVCHP